MDLEAIYAGLDRAGPGSAEHTRRARALTGRSGALRVLGVAVWRRHGLDNGYAFFVAAP